MHGVRFRRSRRDFLTNGAWSAFEATVLSARDRGESIVAACSALNEKQPLDSNERLVIEATIEGLHAAMDTGQLTVEELVSVYLDRIVRYDRAGPFLNSVLELNPDVYDLARQQDRLSHENRGKLYGIPVLLKDNIDTFDRMHTTAGSWALYDSRPIRDARVVERIRSAGAIILGKANMSE